VLPKILVNEACDAPIILILATLNAVPSEIGLNVPLAEASNA
jgi:hypothetical protein